MQLPLLHPPIIIGDTSFDLSHLTAFAVAIPGKGMISGTDLGVVILFSNHVFTERTKDGEEHDVIDHLGTKRRFDSDRYYMSIRLPELLKVELETNGLTYISRSFGGFKNLIFIQVEDDQTWTIVFCFVPIKYGVRMEILSAYPKVVYPAKISRKPLSHFARTCIFKNERIPKI